MPTNDPTAAERMEASRGRRYVVTNKTALRAARHRQHLTQAAVAAAAGCHESFYWRLERDRVIATPLAAQIADAVNEPFDALFEVDAEGTRARLRPQPHPLPEGDALRQARVAAGLSQAALAHVISRHVSAISGLENPELVSAVLAEKIAEVLGIDVLDAFAPPQSPDPQDWQRLPLRKGTRGSAG